MDGADAPENTLGVASSLRLNLQDLGLDLSVRDRQGADNDDQGGHNADQDECKLPLADEGDDKGGDECGDGLDNDSKLLCDTRLDQLPVGGCLHRDGTGDALVEVGDLLTEGGLEVGSTDISSKVVCDVGKEGSVYVGREESNDADVDEVQTGLLVMPKEKERWLDSRSLFHSRHEALGDSARGGKVVEKSDELSNDHVDHG